MRGIRLVGSIALPLAGLAGAAAAQALGPDPEAGRALALEWCADCHVVAEDAVGGDAGPPFGQVVANPEKDLGELRAWLTDPHPVMPDFSLSEPQIQDILAYLETLRP